MNFEINKLSLNFAIASALLLLFSYPSLAITDSIEQLIHIESDTQLINIKNNIITCIGNVLITQGTIKINADRVVISRSENEQGKEIIDGYGSPATFYYQIYDSGKPLKARAAQIHYELPINLVILIGDAYLEQLDSSLTGDKIIYLVKEKKMQAYSKKGKRVTAILIPSQFQDTKESHSSRQKSN